MRFRFTANAAALSIVGLAVWVSAVAGPAIAHTAGSGAQALGPGLTKQPPGTLFQTREECEIERSMYPDPSKLRCYEWPDGRWVLADAR